MQLPKTRTYLPLTSAAEVPVGSVIDATSGKVALTSAVNNHGATKTGEFTAGSFVVRQPHGRHPKTFLLLTGGSFASCSRTRLHGPIARMDSARPHPSHRVVRQLWGSDHGGSFVTVGGGASAAVRGTVWLTEDRCDGTLIHVFKGHVVVHPAGTRRTLVLGPGQSYLARAHR
ncbi:MAG: hypothetical protein JOZ81_01255 [Chloroflexi bacterium]|nr:hypothetical protein [Chloroflexota bacterium]